MSESLHYRFAAAADLDATARLAAHSFPGATRPPEWWRAQLREPLYGGGPEITLLGESAGRIIAACQVHPLRQFVAGAALACAGIGTVAISPTHRKRGLGAELVAAALRAARERGEVLSALYPFRTSFYQRLGYGQAGEALQYQVSPGELPDSPERLHVELIEDGHGRGEVQELYARWAATQTGQLERGPRVWSELLDLGDRVLVGYRGHDGRLDGYALVLYRADVPAAERYAEVEELVWTSEPARQGLYGWLASLGDQWPRLLLRELPSHRLGDWLREPRLPPGAAPPWRLWAPGAVLLMGTMARVVNVEAAWRQRSVAPDAAMSITLSLTDDQIPENAGTWQLTLEDGRVDVARDSRPTDALLRMDVSTLSRLFMGALTPSAALRAGLLECGRTEVLPRLDVAFALPEPWTFDRF